MTETYSLAHIKAHLSALVQLVDKEQERVVLTKNGRPAAVLMSIGELESLEETLDVLSDPDALREIRQAQKEADAGLGIPLEEVLRKDGVGE